MGTKAQMSCKKTVTVSEGLPVLLKRRLLHGHCVRFDPLSWESAVENGSGAGRLHQHLVALGNIVVLICHGWTLSCKIAGLVSNRPSH